VVELGAGLGLVSILLEKMQICSQLVVTDGDEPTLNLLIENKIDCECDFSTAYLYWGNYLDFLSDYPEKFDICIAADVIYEEEQIEPLLMTVKALMKGIENYYYYYFFKYILLLFFISILTNYRIQIKYK
jgi:predicted nicotinamide N-methyase